MRLSVTTKSVDGALSPDVAGINVRPDKCPICHNGIEAIFTVGFKDKGMGYTGSNKHKALQVIYRCPIKHCSSLFIAHYESDSTAYKDFRFIKCRPVEPTKRDFESGIIEISPQFPVIYNQAAEAEAQGLDQICGPGYRKALEFLVKDYLVSLTPGESAAIQNMFLGRLIQEKISSQNIKKVAERAAWLGNDETHYVRKWDQQDLEDLKRLINATVHWISEELLIQTILKEMPDKDK